MKKILALLIVLLLCISSTGCTVSHGKNKEHWQVAFEINKTSFEELNGFLLDQYAKVDNDKLSFSFMPSEESKQIESIYSSYSNEYIYLDDHIKELFTNVKKAFIYDFSVVTIQKNRISYYGEGNEMFVYSLDGKKPKTFWPSGKKAYFSTYSLGDNWYYLFLRQR